MKIPLEISFRNVDKTDDIENLIREKAAKLDKICHYLTSCHIAVERRQQHQRSGNPYRVCIYMGIPPRHEIVIKRETSKGDMHDPLTKVLRDAFETAYIKLQGVAERRRGEVKTHPEQETMAFVVKLFSKEGYGFIKTFEGREIYFHKNSVLHNDFDRLEIGTGVRFVLEKGEKGPQASTVQIVDKPSA